MINIRSTPVGSYVQVCDDHHGWNTCQVVEILRDDRLSVLMVDVCDGTTFVVGKVYTFPITKVAGIRITPSHLQRLGFSEAAERGWLLSYWFGLDMQLLYRHNQQKHVASFRFKSSYRKRYVSISCEFIHELQNIMSFLTGDELIFEYRPSSLSPVIV